MQLSGKTFHLNTIIRFANRRCSRLGPGGSPQFSTAPPPSFSADKQIAKQPNCVVSKMRTRQVLVLLVNCIVTDGWRKYLWMWTKIIAIQRDEVAILLSLMFKSTIQICCQWKTWNSTLRHPKTPEPMATKIGRGNYMYIPDIYPCAKLHYDPIREFCPTPHAVSYTHLTLPTNREV